MEDGMTRKLRPLIIVATLIAAALTIVPAAPAIAQNALPTVVSADPRDGTPQILDGQVNGIVQFGDRVIAAGVFTQVRNFNSNTIFTRTNLMAFSFSTGKVDQSFAPNVNGDIDAMIASPDGQHVYISGTFNQVNGVSAKKVAEIDATTGELVTTFKANANNGEANDIKLFGNRLFVGGSFTQINGVTRNGFAAVDPITGAVLPDVTIGFTGSLKAGINPWVKRFAITPDGSRLVALGNFTTVTDANNLTYDRTQIAMLDLTTSPVSVANWQTNRFKDVCASVFQTYMRDVDFSPDGSYFAVVTTGAYRANLMCDTSSRWETNATGSGLLPTWIDWTGGDTQTQVAVTGTAIYTGGHQRWENNPYRGDNIGPGAVARGGIAALDPVNGLPLNWDPERDPRGVGVWAFTVTDEGLWVGMDTDNIGHEFHSRIAFMPLDGGEVLPPNNPYTLPNDLYNVESSTGNLVRRNYDGTAFGTRSTAATGLTAVRGAFALNGNLYTGTSAGTMNVQTFDGTTLGTPTAINLNGLQTAPPTSFRIPGTTTPIPSFATHLSKMTGMFFDNGRIYYTVSGDLRLYYRYFTPSSQVVGASLFVSSTGDGVAWNNVNGMTMANGNLYYALNNGNLFKAPFNPATGRPSGASVQIGGPAVDGYNWTSRGLFAFNQVADSNRPSQPGKPTGVSNTIDSIDLAWPASHDSVSQTLSYRVYRDGVPTPIATFNSASTTTVTFTDPGLASGSTHTYTVDATDAATNTSLMSPTSDPITVQVPDTTPPSVPGQPTGVANGKTKIDLTWAASTDNKSTSLLYNIYRDGGSTPVGQVTSSSSTTVGFTDTGLAPGSTHTYTVDATDDAINTSSQSAPSDPITTIGNIFTDAFDSGDFSAWTSVTRMTIDPASGGVSTPSAQMNTVNQNASAFVDLPSTYTSVCVSGNVNVVSTNGSALDLLKVRSAGGGPIAKAYLTATGKLAVRSDFAATQKVSNAALVSGWNALELCGTVGSATGWDLYLNGTKVVDNWIADTGTLPVARVQIGDTVAKTILANWDDIVVDQIVG
jgi:hypothetical protein